VEHLPSSAKISGEVAKNREVVGVCRFIWACANTRALLWNRIIVVLMAYFAED